MPKHLDEVQLNKEAQALITSLGLWLANSGQYRPDDKLKAFDMCVPDQGAEREIRALGAETTKLITNGPIYCGIARPKDERGGRLFNPNTQYLLSLRVSGDVSPFVSDGKYRTAFPPGKAVYCAPGNEVFVSAGIEFAFVHWATG